LIWIRADATTNKIEMLFHERDIYSASTQHTHTNDDTMADNQNPIRDPRNLEENGMNEYERRTVEWNQCNQVQEMRRHRAAAINNTDGYRTGNRIHHIRSIQMHDPTVWNQLFGREILDPELRDYAQASMDWANDQTHTLLFAGQMEVSLLMQENYRPGVHVAIFFIHLTPNRRFRDGHMIQMEFGNGSHTHQTICRIFDVTDRAIVLQATEYQMLGYLADDDEAMDLLHSCFLQPDFAPMRYTFVEPDPNDADDNGFYVNDQNALDNHRWHEFAGDQQEPLPRVAEIVPEDEEPAAVFAIPPPPPANEDFAEIYRRNLYIINNAAAAENADDADDADDYIDNRYHQGPRRNIIHYIYNDGDSDSDSDDDDNGDELPARG
jgi:hypothetical protein